MYISTIELEISLIRIRDISNWIVDMYISTIELEISRIELEISLILIEISLIQFEIGDLLKKNFDGMIKY
jgi:hypothetical protein